MYAIESAPSIAFDQPTKHESLENFATSPQIACIWPESGNNLSLTPVSRGRPEKLFFPAGFDKASAATISRVEQR